MKCTRCQEEVIEGKNIPIAWHVPICFTCRRKMKDVWGKEDSLTEQEDRIMKLRLNQFGGRKNEM